MSVPSRIHRGQNRPHMILNCKAGSISRESSVPTLASQASPRYPAQPLAPSRFSPSAATRPTQRLPACKLAETTPPIHPTGFQTSASPLFHHAQGKPSSTQCGVTPTSVKNENWSQARNPGFFPPCDSRCSREHFVYTFGPESRVDFRDVLFGSILTPALQFRDRPGTRARSFPQRAGIIPREDPGSCGFAHGIFPATHGDYPAGLCARSSMLRLGQKRALRVSSSFSSHTLLAAHNKLTVFLQHTAFEAHHENAGHLKLQNLSRTNATPIYARKCRTPGQYLLHKAGVLTGA